MTISDWLKFRRENKSYGCKQPKKSEDNKLPSMQRVKDSFDSIIFRMKQALKKSDKGLFGVLSTQAAKVLNFEQRARLPPEIKERVMKKYEIIKEKEKL